MYKILTLITLLLFINGCAQNSVNLSPIGQHQSLAMISSDGLAIDNKEAKKLKGKTVKIWGYLDYENISTCGLSSWYFSLKTTKDTTAGNSIHIITPATYKFKDIFDKIWDMKDKDQKTPVLITGKLNTFVAPTNFSTLVGIEILVDNPKDIEFK